MLYTAWGEIGRWGELPAKFLDSDRYSAYNDTISCYSLIDYSITE